MFDHLLGRGNKQKVTARETHLGGAAALALMERLDKRNPPEAPPLVVAAPKKPEPELKGLTIEEFDAMRSYADVAESVGFRPSQLVLCEIYDFLEKSGIEIYDNNDVRKWLDSKLPPGVKFWCWRPLRKKDVLEEFRWGFDSNSSIPTSSAYYSHSRWECRQYDSLVPLHALKKAEALTLRFGDDVKIFVSDFAVPDADPFMMVRPTLCDSGSGGRQYKVIIDMWDEPGFGKA